jgi:hypothetical protein
MKPLTSWRRITQDEYDKKARELKERQTEIALRVEQHQKGEGDFRTTLESLISLASRAAELFERSKPEQKRQLLAFVFSSWRPNWFAKKREQDFYNEVVKFVRGEAHDIRPRTIGMTKAEIANRLIAESPDLLAEDKRPDLIKAVNLVYERDSAVVVTLTDKDLAVVRMACTHADDLPQA